MWCWAVRQLIEASADASWAAARALTQLANLRLLHLFLALFPQGFAEIAFCAVTASEQVAAAVTRGLFFVGSARATMGICGTICTPHTPHASSLSTHASCAQAVFLRRLASVALGERVRDDADEQS